MSELQQTWPQESSTLSPTPQGGHSASTPVLDGYLRREELARQLGLSPRTIDRWESLRIGPPRVSIGRTILYKAESVLEWLNSQERHFPPTRKR